MEKPNRKDGKEVKQKYNKHLIIPMTIYKEENFNYIYNGLKDIDQDIHHFALRLQKRRFIIVWLNVEMNMEAGSINKHLSVLKLSKMKNFKLALLPIIWRLVKSSNSY